MKNLGKETTCKKCGKIGKLTMGFPEHVGLVHNHYCPIKYQERKAKKEIENQKKIDIALKNFDGYSFYLPFSDSKVFKLFPYTGVGIFDEISIEEKIYFKKLKELNLLIKEHLETKRKWPTEKQTEKMINSLKESK